MLGAPTTGFRGSKCKLSLGEFSPRPALQQRRNCFRVFGNTRDWIGRTVCHQSERVTGDVLSPGERKQVREDKHTSFKRSHKVIVPLTVQEILDEQVAMKLV